MFDEDLRRLADEAGSAARAAQLTDLVRRAQRRRWRRRTSTGVAGLAAVAAIVVAAITVPGQVDSGPTTPASTSSHSPQPTATSTQPPTRRFLMHHPAALVNQPGSHLVQVSYADADHAAALWEVCSPVVGADICPEVVTWTSDGWGTSRAAVIPDKLNIYALPDGSVVVWLFGGGFVLGPDGQRHPITLAHAPISRPPGGALTNLSGPLWARQAGMFDSRNDTVYPALTSPATRCLYDDQWDANGTLWEYGASHCGPAKHATFAWSSDLGRTWSTRQLPHRPVLGLVTSRHRTAVLLGGAGKGLHAALTSLLFTDDEGASWHQQNFPSSSRVSVWSAAATQDGRLFVCDGANVWAANAAWSALHLVQQGRLAAIGVTSADDDVVAYSLDVQLSSDGGRTWTPARPRPSP